MEAIPFTLKVPGRDDMTWSEIAGTSYRFGGLLRLEADALLLEWTGSAAVEEVGFTGVRTEQIALPSESLTVPLSEIRSLRLAGGWIRPHLEITANDLDPAALRPKRGRREGPAVAGSAGSRGGPAASRRRAGRLRRRLGSADRQASPPSSLSSTHDHDSDEAVMAAAKRRSAATGECRRGQNARRLGESRSSPTWTRFASHWCSVSAFRRGT